MKFEKAYEALQGIPFISIDNAKELYGFILKNKPQNILELGIGYGTSSAYIAAALQENGEGRLTCVDLIEAKDEFDPSAEQLIKQMGFQEIVEIIRMKSGYNWFLHNEIRAQSENATKACEPKYDLIIIDGPKNWTIDSSSFFLSDKLLKQAGWIIWDDYNWSYAKSDAEITDRIDRRKLDQDEQSIPHIKEIFNLLVMPHQNYGNFIIQEDSGWAWAQKVEAETKIISYQSSRSVKSLIIGILRKLLK